LVYKKTDVYSGEFEELGWIKCSNLILNSYALLNKNSIPRKAMALVSLDDAKVQLQKVDIEKFKLYYGPDNDSEKGEAKKFEIYYVFKEVKGKKLLARADKLSGSQISLESNVAGWIANFHVTDWDSRLCLEISSKTDAVNSYSNKEIPVYPTIEKLTSFLNSGIEKTDGSIMKFNLKPSRPDPYIMRMPVISNLDNQLNKEVATVGSLEKSTDQQDVASIMRKIQNAKNKLENVNILFVIDGTVSMKAYFKPVAKSIEKIIQNNNLLGANNKLRFGVVIYRDYPDEEGAVEVEPLTANYEDVIRKIANTECKSNPMDPNLPEAQYNGIINGLKKAGLNKDQSNIIVLIGDAGNHNPDPQGLNINQVCQTLKDYEASLVTFQVINGKDQTYTDFNFDAQDMLIKTGGLYKDRSRVKLEEVDLKNTYKLNFKSASGSKDIPDLYMFGRFTYASGTEPMATSLLEKNIVNTTREYVLWVENVLSMCENIKTGNSDLYSEDIIIYLKTKLGLTENDIGKLKKIKEFSFIGYTATRFYGNDVDCYQPVVFLSQDELSQTIDIFKLYRDENQTGTEKKDNLKKVLVAQTMKMLGEVSEDNILDKNLEDIWQIILAIPFDKKGKYGSLGKKKLRDLNKLSDKEMSNYMESFFNDFDSKIRNFQIDAFRPYSFETANQTFYWIPLSRFPGND
jgi:hypothetical protein